MGKEKKEIGKLLNEYDPYIASDGEHKPNLWGYAYQGHSAIFPKELAESYIISARYGFIKWLVEHHKLLHPDFVQHLKLFYGDSMPEENFYLMMLAISPNPIEELCKMLRPN